MAEQPQQPIGGPKPIHVINPNPGKVTPRVLQASQLSPAERLLMEQQFGYDGKSDVPSDMGTRLAGQYSPEEVAARREELLLQAAGAMPPNSIAKPSGLDADQVPTQQLTMSDAELQQLFRSRAAQPSPVPVSQPQPAPAQPPVTQQTFAGLPFKAAAPAGPQVTASDIAKQQFEAVRSAAVTQITEQKEVGELHPDIAQAYTQTTASPPPARPVPQPQEPTQPQPERQEYAPAPPAADSNKPITRGELIEKRRSDRENELRKLDTGDYDRFKQAVITGGLYTKTYTGLGGSLQVTFSDSHGHDEDMLTSQRVINNYKKRFQQTDDDGPANEAMFQYALAVCLRSIHVSKDNGQTFEPYLDIPLESSVDQWASQLDRDALCPRDLHPDDTNLYAWSAYLHRELLKGSLRQAVYSQFRKFQVHVLTLQYVGQDPESF